MSTITGLTISVGMVVFNFILYFVFGMLLCGTGLKDKKVCPGMTILAGFFLYYSLFTLLAVPMVYRWRPFSMLSCAWSITVIVVIMCSLLINRKLIGSNLKQFGDYLKGNTAFAIGAALIVAIQLIIVVSAYQFTLDAAYYVANVATTVQTNTMNIYDPYSGDWQDHFEMRYFFATYPLQDAVMCSVFKIPALLQTKTIMASVVIILTNMLYCMIGRRLGLKNKGILLMLVFAGVINFYFITIYTASNFLMTRTYEGKSILGNIVLPGILYLYMKLLEENRGRYWMLLFVLSFGSTVISNSANMLVPAALLVLFLPYCIRLMMKGQKAEAVKSAFKVLLCMLPCLLMVFIYIAYVRGYFVFYTYPR